MTALARLFRGDPDHRPPTVLGLGITVAAVVGLVVLPYVIDQFYIGVLTEILIFGLWAMGINVLLGTTGLVTLGHAGILGLSVYTVSFGQGRLGLSFWLAGALAIAVTMIVSALLSLTITRAYGVYFLMITLAQGMLIWGVAQRWVSITDGDNGLRTATRPPGLSEYYAYYWFTLAVLVVVVVALRWFLTSPSGLRLRAIKDSPSRMEALGYSVTIQKFVAFNVAALVAAIAGVLYAGWFQFVSPATAFLRQSVQGLLMVILGGLGFFFGPIIGAFAVIGAQTALRTYTDRWSLVMGLILIVTVLYSPAGISGIASAVFERLRGQKVDITSAVHDTDAAPAAPDPGPPGADPTTSGTTMPNDQGAKR